MIDYAVKLFQLLDCVTSCLTICSITTLMKTLFAMTSCKESVEMLKCNVLQTDNEKTSWLQFIFSSVAALSSWTNRCSM